jgi:subtilisin family serine protease
MIATNPASPARNTTVYVAQLAEQADLGTVRGVPRGPERRVAAWDLLESTAARTQPALEGVLVQLKADGIVRDWHGVPLGNSMIVTIDRAREQAFEQALHGTGLLRSLERDMLAPGWLPVPDALASPAQPMPELPTVGDEVGVPWNIGRIRADRAWDRGVRGEGVTVGVLDTGIQATHASLRGAYRGTGISHDYAWFDPSGSTTIPTDMADFGHGTAVASNIVGHTPKSQIGVAPGATLVAATFGNPHQKPDDVTGTGMYANALLAWQWMLAPTDSRGQNRDPRLGVDIINNSWRIPPLAMFGVDGIEHDGTFDALGTALEQLDAAGILSVGGAGNEGEYGIGAAQMPTASPFMLTAGATTKAGAPWRGSSHGPVRLPSGASLLKPDVSAPGLRVPTAIGDGDRFYLDGMATSIASPQVAGAAALIMSAYPQLEPYQVRELLQVGARDIGPPGVDMQSGWGVIDIDRSLDIAERRYGSIR